MKAPSVEEALAFVPKGRPVTAKEFVASMTSDGFDPGLCRLLLQRLLDPDDLGLVKLDGQMRLTV